MTHSEPLSPLKQAFLALEKLQNKLDQMEQAQREPIAIIGMGCRYPHGANTPQAFWEMLRDGRDAVTEIPPDRWEADAYYDPDPQKPGKIAARWGGFLDKIADFDARFFGIAPREVVQMDPQQRLLLEVAWEALEAAGQPVERLAGSLTGVYVGLLNSEYGWLQLQDVAGMDAYSGTGTSHSVASGRLSYFLGLQGPSMTLDTACSSSLVAIHTACQALRARECHLALAGGVSVMLSPLSLVPFSRMGLLAGDGRCKTLDARADGFVGGEGCGLLVLKRLSDAQADGDPILALIHGSAVNQDGRTNVLSAPNGLSQTAVIRQALANARLEANDISFVEMHGTGTVYGDPIEVDALREVFGSRPDNGLVCPLGAIKSNIGHTAAAAGVAGVIKSILALKNETIPPNLHFQALNPHISLEGTPFVVPVSPRPWPAGDRPRYAGVSSFGWSGTNAHLILSDPPSEQPISTDANQPTFLLPLSARDPQALRDLAVAYREHLQETAYSGSQSVADIVHTAAVRRSHHPHRTAVVGRSHYHLAEQLLEAGEQGSRGAEEQGSGGAGERGRLAATAGRHSQTRKLVFIFSPHGSQWVGMGRRLWSQSPVFREAILRCQAAMSAYIDWSVAEKFAEESDSAWLEQIDILQPTLFALQVGLTEMWRAWGVEPDAIVGHSMGEVAATHAAGVLSLDEAARIICRRTQLLSRVRGDGAMGVVELSYAEAQKAIAPFNGRLNVAVSNSPRSTVISGEPDALEALFDQLEEQEIFCGWGVADVASHTPKMLALRDELAQAIGPLSPNPARIPLYSTVSGTLSDGRQFDREYWVQHLNQPVLFADTVRGLAESGHNLFLEISPGPLLAPAIEEGLYHLGHEGVILTSLRRDANEYESMLAALGHLYSLGYAVQWSKLYPQGHSVPLPTYPWQRERFWLAADTQSLLTGLTGRGRRAGDRGQPPLSPILGERLELAQEPQREVWQNLLDRRLLPALFQYRLFDTPLISISSCLEMVLSAVHNSQFPSPYLTHLQLHEPLPLAEEAPWTEIQFVINHQPDGTALFHLYHQQQDRWVKQADGRLQSGAANDADSLAETVDISALLHQCPQTTTNNAFYQQLETLALSYGPELQSVEQLWRGENQAIARLRLSESVKREMAEEAMPTAVLDPCFQLLSWSLSQSTANELFLPTAVAVTRPLQTGVVPEWVHVTWQPLNHDTFLGQATLLDSQGVPLLALGDIRLERLGQTAVPQLTDSLYETIWQPSPLPIEGQEMRPGFWLILAGSDGVGAALAAQLRDEGNQVVLVEAATTLAQAVSDTWRIRSDQPEDYVALLTAVFTAKQQPCRGIIYLWGLDTPTLDSENRAVKLDYAVGPLLHLIQAIKKLYPDQAYPCWLVTQGAQPIMAPPQAVAQSPLWGMGYVLAEEQRELWGGLVDLDPAANPVDNATQLRQQLQYGRDEDRVAFRQGQWYVARLSPHEPASATAASPWRPDAAYLITGGLGEIALQLAPWAVAQGARRLILLGRTPLPPRAEWSQLDPHSQAGRRVRTIQALEGMGAAVHWAAVDVGDQEQLYRFLDDYAAEGWPPIRGVIHAAAVIEDRMLLDLDPASLQRVLDAKSKAAWLLHRYFDDQRPLDFFVLFSSIASLLGSAGQASYAAANAFLDGLAHLRQAEGQHALSVNWGFWGDVGFATTPAGRRLVAYMRDLGMSPLTNTQALDAFDTLLTRPELAQTAVLRVDWRRWQAQSRLVGLPPFLRLVVPDDDSVERVRPLFNIRAQLEAAPPGPARTQKFQTFLREQLADVLKIDPAHIDRETSLGDLGIDSFTAIELRNRLERSLGIVLSATMAWNYPTIAAMTPYLAEKMDLSLTPETNPGAMLEKDDEIAAFLNQVNDLSEEELRQLLSEDL